MGRCLIKIENKRAWSLYIKEMMMTIKDRDIFHVG